MFVERYAQKIAWQQDVVVNPDQESTAAVSVIPTHCAKHCFFLTVERSID